MPVVTASDYTAQEEPRRVADWRKDSWLKLGWDKPWATFLSETQIDVYVAAKMLSQGAPKDQVVRILAGYGPLGADPQYDWAKHTRLLNGEPEPEEQVEETTE